jgi:hypothetical protein
MDTASFFKKILPTSGVRFLVEWVATPNRASGGFFKHHPFGEDSADEMAGRANQISAAGGNVYFACASFKEVIYKANKTGHEYPAGRSQDNALYARALWLDMDVGKTDTTHSYPTQRDAGAAVAHLLKSVGLPRPMIVSSGAGLHVYWPLTENVDAHRWTAVAAQLKSVCAHLGVKADPSRTADIASILRPIGTTNPKHGKPVKLLADVDPVNVGDIAAKLADYILANHVHHARHEKLPSLNAALIGEPIEYPPSYPDAILKQCAVMQTFHDRLGNVSEPFWYGVLGVLKTCEGGGEIAHEWSKGHPAYDYDTTQAKMDQWAGGPTTCKKLEAEANLGVCSSCPHNGKVRSPIQLGYRAGPAQEILVPVSNTKTDITDEMDTVKLPENFMWSNRVLSRFVAAKDGDGEGDWVPFSDTLFYPTSRVRDEEGEWSLRIRMSVANHYWREFDLPICLIPDPRGLSRHLGKYEIVVFGAIHAMHMLKDYLKLLMEQNTQLITYDRFGWDDDMFIIGTTGFNAKGEAEKVIVTENVEKSRRDFDNEPVGTVEEWAAIIDEAYNRPNAEKYQFIIATAFASPLIPLADFDNYRGIPVALSGEGGIGKSSICKAAATIYARPEALMVDASEKNGATIQGLFGLASMYNGVPLLMDEMTERDPKDFPPLMYSLSNGLGKIRMTSGGKFADTVKPFSGIKWITSNNNLTDDIYAAEKQQVAEAVEARCFEISGLTKSEMATTFAGTNMKALLEDRLFSHQHGTAGQKYLAYVIANQDTIIHKVRELRHKLGEQADADSRERYYIDTIAFAHVGATVAKRLGLIHWDVNAMTKWAVAHIKSLRRNFWERSAAVEDKISLFFSWLHDSTIVTRKFPDGRPKQGEFEVPAVPVRKAPKARVATSDMKMLVRIDAINEWCAEYNVAPTQFKNQLKQGNYILAERIEYVGKGTNVISGRARCYEMDYKRIVGYTHAVQDGNVSTIVRPDDGVSPKVSQT